MLQPALRQRLQVTQQCRSEDLERVRERYRNHDIPAELGTYFEDMETRLADCNLFIGRAGASTIAELTAVGRPAILKIGRAACRERGCKYVSSKVGAGSI